MVCPEPRLYSFSWKLLFRDFADFRGHLTCLIPTQFRSLTRPFFLVFSGFENGDMDVV